MQSLESYRKNRRRSRTSWPTSQAIDVKKDDEIYDAELLAIVDSFCHWRHYLKKPYYTLEVLINNNNLRAFMSTDKLTQRHMQLALNLSAFDFWLVYYKGTFNPADGPSRRLHHKRDTELKDSMTNNTQVPEEMLFSSVAAVTSQSISPMEEKSRQILVVDTSDSRFLNQRREARGAVSNESIYDDVSKYLIDPLSEFLQANLFANRVPQRLAIRESNSDWNIDLREQTKHGELFYKGSVLYIPKVEAFQMEILKKHHNNSLAGHLATKKT